MEIINKEYTVLEPFTIGPWKGLTFKEVKKLSKNKSDNYVHKTLKKFVKARILREKKIGNNLLYSIDDNVKALNIIGFIEEYKANTLKHIPDIQNILDKMITPYYSLVITGSYVKNKQTEESDLDVVIICDDERNPNSILAEIKQEAELSTPEIHLYVFTKSQLLEMLTNKEANYGKETAKNKLIVTGAKEYYSILMEAIKNGFNG